MRAQGRWSVGRRLADGRHLFRLSPGALVELHVDAEAAARAGDFSWIVRFAGGDAELAGVALLVMGNPVGAARRLAAAAPSPRRNAFAALADWAARGDAAGDAAADALAACPPSPARDALAALVEARGPLQALFVGGPMDRIAAVAPAFEGVWTAVGRPDPATGRIAVHPVGDAPPPRGSDRVYDLILVDPSHWLPPDLDAVEGTAVAFIGDLEWHFAHDPARYARFDALLALGSQGALEARRRFGRPSFVGPIAGHIGLLSCDPAFLDLADAGAAWRARDRALDLLSTGRQRHMVGFYVDKPAFNQAILSVAPRFSVRMLATMLPDAAYRETMASARFVAASHRYALGQSWRVFESLGAGAMALVDATGGGAARFSEDFGAIHGVRSERLGADLDRHLAAWPAYAERFAPRAGAFFAELDSLVPPPARGAAQFIRATLLGATLARFGAPDAAMARWRGAEAEPSAWPADEAGAGVDHAAPIVQSRILAVVTEGWRGDGGVRADREETDADYAAALDVHATLHLRRVLNEETDATLAAAAAALATRFPRRGLPRLLLAAARWRAGSSDALDAALDAVCAPETPPRFALLDGRPEWRLGPLSIADVIDAAMRDALRADGAETPNLETTARAMGWALRGGDALRRGAHGLAAEAATEALRLRGDLAFAAGTLLQARRRIWLARPDDAAAATFLAAFEALTAQDEAYFGMFAWTAMRMSLAGGATADADALARRWATHWARRDRPDPASAIPKWAWPDPEAALARAPIRQMLAAAGFPVDAALR